MNILEFKKKSIDERSLVRQQMTQRSPGYYPVLIQIYDSEGNPEGTMKAVMVPPNSQFTFVIRRLRSTSSLQKDEVFHFSVGNRIILPNHLINSIYESMKDTQDGLLYVIAKKMPAGG